MTDKKVIDISRKREEKPVKNTEEYDFEEVERLNKEKKKREEERIKKYNKQTKREYRLRGKDD